MDTLQGMKVFVRVAQLEGFAAGARDLRMSPASVTKHVAALESRVGARLFDRTTRRVSLTEAGRLYLERSLECLQAFDDADASMSALAKQPRGLLRVTAPIDLEGPLSPIVGRFTTTYPEVTVDLRLSNRPVDLVEESIDVAVRVAVALDGQHVARPLASTRVGMFASPAYLHAHGRPRRPEDLAKHRSLVFNEPRLRDEWTFERAGKQVRVKLEPVMMSNSGAALRSAMIAGAGLAMLPSFLLGPSRAPGGFETILPEWKIAPELRLFALYPHRRLLSPKVRAFVEALQASFGDGVTDPWWPAAPAERPAAAGRSPSRRPSRARPA